MNTSELRAKLDFYTVGKYLLLLCVVFAAAAALNDTKFESWCGWADLGISALIVAGLFTKRLPISLAWATFALSGVFGAVEAVYAAHFGTLLLELLCFPIFVCWTYTDRHVPSERECERLLEESVS